MSLSAAPFAAAVRMGWRRWSAYRTAMLAGAVTNGVFGLIRAAIVGGTVGAAGGTLVGYDPLDAATFVWLGQAYLSVVSLFWNNELADRIKTGDISVDLTRPIDPQLAYLGADLGRAGVNLAMRAGPVLLVGLLTTGLALPAQVLPYLLGCLSLTIAVVISFAVRWLISLAAFWLVDMRGVATLFLVASNLLSGLAIPVHWFPGWLAALAAATPFPSMLQAPIDVTMGYAQGLDAAATIGVQLAWAAGMLLAGRAVWSLAVRRLVVQGG